MEYSAPGLSSEIVGELFAQAHPHAARASAGQTLMVILPTARLTIVLVVAMTGASMQACTPAR